MSHHQKTEHETDIYIPDGDERTHVDVGLYGGGIEGAYGGAVWLSLTPKEARTLANALLNRADRVEILQPHGNE